MNEADPSYDDNYYSVDIYGLVEEQSYNLSGPNFSFIPTEYTFSLEAPNSTSWIYIETFKA